MSYLVIPPSPASLHSRQIVQLVTIRSGRALHNRRARSDATASRPGNHPQRFLGDFSRAVLASSSLGTAEARYLNHLTFDEEKQPCH